MGAPTTANTVLDLTTLARVKTALKLADADTARDAALSQFITELSMEFASLMKRWTLSARRQEIVHFSAGRKTVGVRGYPVTTFHTVQLAETEDFAGVSNLAATDYHTQALIGLVHLRIAPQAVRRAPSRVPMHPAVARVDYTGGMAVDTAALIANYPDLAAACEQQVAYLWQRSQRNALGSNSTTGPNGETKFEGQYDLLPTVRAVVDRYTRRAF